MSFDTPVYFIFLTGVVLLYWRLPWRGQNLLLLAASYFFYACWDWRFLSLIATSTVADYWLARIIERSKTPGSRRAALVVSLVLNFGFLGVFKYFNFFVGSFGQLADWFGANGSFSPALRIILPVGISFYTFQAVAYIVDVYHRKMPASEDFISYALFISFFPHLVAGPIQRPSHLLPQAEHPRRYDPRKLFDGLMLIATGLFRKCVIADNCALLANAAFGGAWGELTLPVVLIGVYAFAWQIYGDFSAYSDIARGSAQLLGFHFMVNFRQPYLSASLSEFWRRWHISLSTWLRDYLYIPLGGNRRGERRTYANLLMTMLLGGLWHGANWTFVAWGALHGAGLAVERFLGLKSAGLRAGSPTQEANPKPWSIWIRRIVIFHLVCFGWLFFRAESLSHAVQMLGGLSHWSWRPEYFTALVFLAVFTVPLFLLDLSLERGDQEYPGEKWKPLEGKSVFVRRAALATALIVIVLVFGATQPSAFIYFQF
jgi:alginate O-acetyltransferase complex protein AlgI